MKRCLACWILALSLAPSLWAQAPALTFEHVTAEDGLSNNWIWAVRQDRQGFLWIGTLDGLDRYDGYTYLAHQHQPNDTTSLAQNEVRDLVEDANGDLWVAAGGLHRLDRATGRFIRYEVGRESPLSIHALAVDGKDHLWLYTDEGGSSAITRGVIPWSPMPQSGSALRACRKKPVPPSGSVTTR